MPTQQVGEEIVASANVLVVEGSLPNNHHFFSEMIIGSSTPAPGLPYNHNRSLFCCFVVLMYHRDVMPPEGKVLLLLFLSWVGYSFPSSNPKLHVKVWQSFTEPIKGFKGRPWLQRRSDSENTAYSTGDSGFPNVVQVSRTIPTTDAANKLVSQPMTTAITGEITSTSSPITRQPPSRSGVL